MRSVIGTAYSAFTTLILISLAACGGGGGGSTTPGAANPVVSKGVIEKFGSVFVNGVEFKTAGATLHLRDDKTDRVLQTEAEVQSLLAKGMVVTVKGAVDGNGTTGTAREIEFRDALKARIDGKGVDSLTVMGQTIIVDDSVKPLLNTLAIGDVVEISGLPDNRGRIRATHIRKKDNLAEFEAKGFIKNLGGSSFTLLLDTTAATGIDVTLGSGVALPAGVTEGSFVEVRTVSTGGVVTATKVELEDELEASENEGMEIEGYVASGSADDFMVSGQRVQTTSSTIFIGGVKSDFAVSMKVEAEGKLEGGILIARKVEFKAHAIVLPN